MSDDKKVENAVANKEKAVAKEEKPLPTMRQPTVNLLEELRGPAALRARETSESFSITCCKLFAALLLKEGRITKEVHDGLDFTIKRGGGFAASKEKLVAQDQEIAELKAQLAKLQGKG